MHSEETRRKISETLRKNLKRTCIGCGERYVREGDLPEQIVRYCPQCRDKCRDCLKVVISEGVQYCDGCKVKHRSKDETPFEELWRNDLRKQRIIKECGHQCQKCKNAEWNGQSIPLELEHINGDRRDGRRENCTVLCPNCHAQTPTWKWRNRNDRG